MRALASALAALFLAVAPASALTLAEIIELSRAGVHDDVLVALIEVEGASWGLTPDEIIELTKAGVSERVLLALVDSSHDAQQHVLEEPLAPDAPLEQAAQVTIVPAPLDFAQEDIIYTDAPGAVVVEHYETVIPVPVFVDVPDKSHKRRRHDRPADAKESPKRASSAKHDQEARGHSSRGREMPSERWARDLPRPGRPASNHPRYTDRSRDLGARDVRAALRSQTQETKSDEKSEKTKSNRKRD
ncbi:MAG: hypothetical protein GEU99_15145 [Luteitalea sp.]|nr:hypothetical protein [Luteitalea sp.]